MFVTMNSITLNQEKLILKDNGEINYLTNTRQSDEPIPKPGIKFVIFCVALFSGTSQFYSKNI